MLIIADQSAEWTVAGLRQLDRLALSLDEFAVENKETAPVLVCIFWRADLDQSQRWIPKHERLTKVAFTTDPAGEAFDLILNTRVFLYRKAVGQLMELSVASREMPAPLSERESWESYFRRVESLPRSREGAWEYITDGNQIDEIEMRFLRGTGKSQDGLVSRYLNRPISRAMTRMLLRFPTAPSAWTLFIFPIVIVASLLLLRGTYWSFLWGLALFQVFSVLDGCDGEIARAKFLESERGRKLDDLCDVLSNILLVLGLGFGLSRRANLAGHPGLFFVGEGLVAAALIAVNEFYLVTRKPRPDQATSGSLGDALYPRHRELVERSGLLRFGENFASWVVQLTKRDVATLFFVFLAAIGFAAGILHLLFVVTAVSLALAVKSFSGGSAS
ncbi:MAG: CDP-alcohol phosphatidyltransferase family protein [Verrucomicrobiota bacterium]|nr:CDP-alcohol phosphatidyltransferase family protein [Verrucomicrobiota bacterium]